MAPARAHPPIEAVLRASNSENAEESRPSAGPGDRRTTALSEAVDCDAATLDAYFQPVAELTWGDPAVGPILRELDRNDPNIIAAVAVVDRSQIRDLLSSDPADRLARACRLARSVSEYRRVTR